ncbi:MAG: type I-E CRISPR-associated protein Cas5/CasD [Proteobacteria bacterium]|nr:MAG: type I-E CRISPR-associated protein Cas5/CasD [Pseudomonadota bacterium]
MPEFLVFQLHGALASWGDIAVGEHRPSLGHPTKSALTGLLAAAIGIEREDDKDHLRLNQDYCFAVCVREPGEVLRDYHTVQVPGGKRSYAIRRDELMFDKHNRNTILSQRDYRTDAWYQVAVACCADSPPYSLEALREKLLKPRFTLYLGRKSCPVSLPLFPQISTASSLKQAFDQYPLGLEEETAANWIDAPKSKRTKLHRYYWEAGFSEEALSGLEATMRYPRRDQVHSRRRWQFSNRNEYYAAETIEEAS